MVLRVWRLGLKVQGLEFNNGGVELPIALELKIGVRRL